MRILIKLKQPRSDDPGGIARRAAAAVGLPVDYLCAASDEWHALAIRCTDDAACREALARLRADTLTYDEVSPDTRRRVDNP